MKLEVWVKVKNVVCSIKLGCRSREFIKDWVWNVGCRSEVWMKF